MPRYQTMNRNDLSIIFTIIKVMAYYIHSTTIIMLTLLNRTCQKHKLDFFFPFYYCFLCIKCTYLPIYFNFIATMQIIHFSYLEYYNKKKKHIRVVLFFFFFFTSISLVVKRKRAKVKYSKKNYNVTLCSKNKKPPLHIFPIIISVLFKAVLYLLFYFIFSVLLAYAQYKNQLYIEQEIDTNANTI